MIYGFNRRFIGVILGIRVWKFKMYVICKISVVKKFKLVYCLRFIYRGFLLCRIFVFYMYRSDDIRYR